jgi:hypothetical protein
MAELVKLVATERFEFENKTSYCFEYNGKRRTLTFTGTPPNQDRIHHCAKVWFFEQDRTDPYLLQDRTLRNYDL